MPAKINLLNQKIGKLTIIEETSQRKNKSVVWKCLCDCGNIVYFSTKELRSDGIIQCPNCGNKRLPQINLTENIINKKFNHLTVLNKTDKKAGGKLLYECQCDCGNPNHIFVSRTDLISGHTKSCGCSKLKYKKGDIINNREIIDINQEEKNQHHYYTCKCLLCNRIYKIIGSSLEKTISCGCQRSIGEFNIIKILDENKIPYYKEYCFPNSLYSFDFAILENNKIIRLIEFDGEQHYESNIKNSGWNTYQKYEYTYQNDQNKNKLAKELNIPLVRIPYWERDNITLELILSDKYLI